MASRIATFISCHSRRLKSSTLSISSKLHPDNHDSTTPSSAGNEHVVDDSSTACPLAPAIEPLAHIRPVKPIPKLLVVTPNTNA